MLHPHTGFNHSCWRYSSIYVAADSLADNVEAASATKGIKAILRSSIQDIQLPIMKYPRVNGEEACMDKGYNEFLQRNFLCIVNGAKTHTLSAVINSCMEPKYIA